MTGSFDINHAAFDAPPGFAAARPVVLQVLPSLAQGGGGVERSAIDVAAAVAAAGGVSLVASRGGALVREVERGGAEHITLPLHSKNPFVMRANIDRLADLIRDRAVTLLHARSRAPAWSAFVAAERTGTPFVTTYHGVYNGRGRLKRIYNGVMARGRVVIANSAFVADHVAATYAVSPSRIRTIYRGVDLERFAADRVSAERMIQLAERWGVPDDASVILLPGRLTRWKGQLDLIDAIGHLVSADVDRAIRCLLVGDDQGRTGYRRALEARIDDNGLSGAVLVTGRCDDMPAAYMLADVVVSASTDPEAFGRIVAEAQAMGRPVVVSDHGGAAEQVIAGETGWLYPPGDAVALAAALRQALDLDPAERDLLASRAVSRVRGHFTKAAMTGATLQVYADVLGCGTAT